MNIQKGGSVRLLFLVSNLKKEERVLVLTCVNLTDAAVFSTPLVPGTHLSTTDCLTSQEKDEVATLLYRESLAKSRVIQTTRKQMNS